MNEKDNKEKIEELRSAYGSNPQNKDVGIQLAQLYVDLGWLNEALDLYRELMSVHVDDYGLMIDYANVCYRRQSFDEAVKTLKTLTTLRPMRIEGWNNLGIALSALQKEEEARKAFENVLELEPDNVGALLNLGNHFHRQGDLEKAKQLFEHAVERSADFGDGWYNLANVYRDQGHDANAIDAYRRAIRVQPNFSSAYKNLGYMLEQKGDWKEAEKCYRSALADSKADSAIYTNLGSICIKLKQYDEAKEFFLRAVRLSPRDLSGWMGLRQISILRGDVVTYVKATLAVLSRLDSDAIAQTCRVLRELERFEECDSLLDRALDLGKKSDELSAEQLLRLQRTCKEPGRAREILEKLTLLSPPTDSVRLALATYYLQAEEYPSALAIIRLTQEKSLFRERLLWRALLASGRIDEAKEEIERYLAVADDCFEAWFQLARIQAEADQDEAARDSLIRALENGFTDIDLLLKNSTLRTIYESLSPVEPATAKRS